LPSGSSAELAVTAGADLMIRKIATPARIASTVTAAITAALEKIRSPGRRLPPLAEARIWPACVVASVRASIYLSDGRRVPRRGAGPSCPSIDRSHID
jgi:hypothetical protein